MDTTTFASSEADLRSLDVRSSLVAVAERRRAADRAEADLLALAVHLVDLHPVEGDTPVATWGLTLDGDESERLLAGTGTPAVAEAAVEAIGAALDVSYRSAMTMVADAVELCFRLPRLWEQVQSGRLQAWKARRVAAHTQALSSAAVGFVDRHAAVLGGKNRVPANVPALAHEALLRCDPETAEGVEEAALLSRGVWFDYRHGDSTATSRLTASLDTLDALDLDATISELATGMGRLGDSSSLDVRRAHALGMLAHPQRALDVFGDRRDDEPLTAPRVGADSGTEVAEVAEVPVRRNAASATVYLHLDAGDLRSQLVDGETAVGGKVERLGAATLDLLRAWLNRAEKVVVRPVLDLSRTEAVDRHDPPEWMRESVVLRDGHCVFPGCTVDARACDQDHITPYVDLDDGGPPGQTSVANLACLCRRHHRMKTFTGWRYHRLSTGPHAGSYQWTNPHRLTYRASPTPKR